MTRFLPLLTFTPSGLEKVKESPKLVGTAKLLELGKLGNVRTRTMRIYDEQEFANIVRA
jgi:uncharacterized protein with GYD domain